ASLREYLEPYVREKLPAWVQGKHQDFVARMTTESGRRWALARIERLSAALEAMGQELNLLEDALERGQLAPAVYFMRNRRNPSLAKDLAALTARWPDAGAPAGAFLAALQRESDGAC